jgi:hypothetical protein
VTDYEEAAVPVLQNAVQLASGNHIEIVGRFVQQEYVGSLQQLRREAE